MKIREQLKSNSKILAALGLGIFVSGMAVVALQHDGKASTPQVGSDQASGIPSARQSDMATQSEQLGSSSTDQTTIAANTVVSNAPTPENKPVSGRVSSVTCNEIKAEESFSRTYETQVASEKKIHGLWQSSAVQGTQEYALELEAENKRDQLALSNMKDNYAKNIAKKSCP